MRKIIWSVRLYTGLTEEEGWFEVPDDATEEEIHELARDDAFNYIDWGWWETEQEGECE